MNCAVGLCAFCGRPLDTSGARTCACAPRKRVVSTLLVSVARAARLSAVLPKLPTDNDVTHYRRALRIARSIERKAA